MKWSDLTLKERKQIYDAVRAENPNASYFDIKSQFDLIPEYEDGGKKIMPPKELGLTPGTPEYYKRQQQISGKANSIQPEVYVTSAGYIKDAIDFGEDVYQGNYGQAMIDVALNALPWGSSKIAKRAKRYLSRMGNSEVTVLNSKSSKSKVKTEADYDSEFSEVIRRERNIKKYNDEISRSIETAVYPDEETLKWLQFTDNMYGTNYQKAYKVTQQELEDFLFDPLNTQLTGSMNKLQYKMYRNKSRFLDRFNRVNPLAIGAPIGLAATNNKDKQSN